MLGVGLGAHDPTPENFTWPVEEEEEEEKKKHYKI
jgi:hypothetical protein